jgi:uncharacterized damage-inducible protein DinB
MLSVKDLLTKQTAEAFGTSDEMSLKSSLWQITQEEASWSPGPKRPSAEQIVRHVAACKSGYCHQGFGTPQLDISSEAAPNVQKSIELLEAAQQTLVQCLAGCSEEDLSRPIPVRFHGQSAAHFFWIMLMHDIWHGGQIRTRRSAHRAAIR